MTISKNVQRVLSITALVILLVAFYFSMNYVFGIFLAGWIINDFIRKETYLLGRVPREEFPVLYWVILLSWVVFCLYYFIY
jgi:hypothetical protein